jgi:hypothetical protein
MRAVSRRARAVIRTVRPDPKTLSLSEQSWRALNVQRIPRSA